MINEDIVTSLNNAVVRGESLQTAAQILINSGYEPSQVYEASRYVQGGVMKTLEPKSDEFLRNTQNPNQQIQYNQDFQKQNNFQGMQNIQNINNNQQIKTKSYKKEIILLVILLFLVGILALTILFRDNILSYLSG